MIICLDGVDGAGKSTLANRLTKEIQKRYPNDTVINLHATQIKSDVYTEYATPLMNYIPGSGIHYILDRWHIGENIYGPLYRGKSAFDKVSYRWIELFLASIGMRLWNVTQTLEVLQQRLNTRGEDFLQPNHIAEVKMSYRYKMLQSAVFADEISPNSENLNKLVNHLIIDGKYAESQAKTIQALGVNYLGRSFIAPKTILVVENTKANKKFDPRINEDSQILLQNMFEDFWKTFAVVSSANLDRLEYFLTEYFWSANVVAYGETVKARLRLKNIPFGEIDKPYLSEKYSYQIAASAENSGKL